MLIKVKRLDYEANYTYAPPQVDALVSTDMISLVHSTEARGTGPFVLVRLKDGSTMTCVGTPDQFLATPYPDNRDELLKHIWEWARIHWDAGHAALLEDGSRIAAELRMMFTGKSIR